MPPKSNKIYKLKPTDGPLSRDDLTTWIFTVQSHARQNGWADRENILVVLKTLMSAGFAEHKKETVRLMREKHPIAEYSFFKASSGARQLSFNAEQVRKADKFLRKRSAPGPNGFGAEHLNAAL